LKWDATIISIFFSGLIYNIISVSESNVYILFYGLRQKVNVCVKAMKKTATTIIAVKENSFDVCNDPVVLLMQILSVAVRTGFDIAGIKACQSADFSF